MLARNMKKYLIIHSNLRVQLMSEIYLLVFLFLLTEYILGNMNLSNVLYGMGIIIALGIIMFFWFGCISYVLSIIILLVCYVRYGDECRIICLSALCTIITQVPVFFLDTSRIISVATGVVAFFFIVHCMWNVSGSLDETKYTVVQYYLFVHLLLDCLLSYNFQIKEMLLVDELEETVLLKKEEQVHYLDLLVTTSRNAFASVPCFLTDMRRLHYRNLPRRLQYLLDMSMYNSSRISGFMFSLGVLKMVQEKVTFRQSKTSEKFSNILYLMTQTLPKQVQWITGVEVEVIQEFPSNSVPEDIRTSGSFFSKMIENCVWGLVQSFRNETAGRKPPKSIYFFIRMDKTLELNFQCVLSSKKYYDKQTMDEEIKNGEVYNIPVTTDELEFYSVKKVIREMFYGSISVQKIYPLPEDEEFVEEYEDDSEDRAFDGPFIYRGSLKFMISKYSSNEKRFHNLRSKTRKKRSSKAETTTSSFLTEKSRHRRNRRNTEDDVYSQPFSSLKILIVDNSVISRTFLTKCIDLLSIEDSVQHEYICCDDGEEAEEFMKTRDILPDIILTEFYMPWMGGNELARKIKDGKHMSVMRNPWCGIFLVTQESFSVNEKQKLRSTQFYDQIYSKPLGFPQLRRIISMTCFKKHLFLKNAMNQRTRKLQKMMKRNGKMKQQKQKSDVLVLGQGKNKKEEEKDEPGLPNRNDNTSSSSLSSLGEDDRLKRTSLDGGYDSFDHDDVDREIAYRKSRKAKRRGKWGHVMNLSWNSLKNVRRAQLRSDNDLFSAHPSSLPWSDSMFDRVVAFYGQCVVPVVVTAILFSVMSLLGFRELLSQYVVFISCILLVYPLTYYISTKYFDECDTEFLQTLTDYFARLIIALFINIYTRFYYPIVFYEASKYGRKKRMFLIVLGVIVYVMLEVCIFLLFDEEMKAKHDFINGVGCSLVAILCKTLVLNITLTERFRRVKAQKERDIKSLETEENYLSDMVTSCSRLIRTKFFHLEYFLNEFYCGYCDFRKDEVAKDEMIGFVYVFNSLNILSKDIVNQSIIAENRRLELNHVKMLWPSKHDGDVEGTSTSSLPYFERNMIYVDLEKLFKNIVRKHIEWQERKTGCKLNFYTLYDNGCSATSVKTKKKKRKNMKSMKKTEKDVRILANICPQALETILVNTIQNAVENTSSGYISIFCFVREYSNGSNSQNTDSKSGIIPEKAKYLCFKILDTGNGIDAAIKETVPKSMIPSDEKNPSLGLRDRRRSETGFPIHQHLQLKREQEESSKKRSSLFLPGTPPGWNSKKQMFREYSVDFASRPPKLGIGLSCCEKLIKKCMCEGSFTVESKGRQSGTKASFTCLIPKTVTIGDWEKSKFEERRVETFEKVVNVFLFFKSRRHSEPVIGILKQLGLSEKNIKIVHFGYENRTVEEEIKILKELGEKKKVYDICLFGCYFDEIVKTEFFKNVSLLVVDVKKSLCCFYANSFAENGIRDFSQKRGEILKDEKWRKVGELFQNMLSKAYLKKKEKLSSLGFEGVGEDGIRYMMISEIARFMKPYRRLDLEVLVDFWWFKFVQKWIA